MHKNMRRKREPSQINSIDPQTSGNKQKMGKIRGGTFVCVVTIIYLFLVWIIYYKSYAFWSPTVIISVLLMCSFVVNLIAKKKVLMKFFLFTALGIAVVSVLYSAFLFLLICFEVH